MSIALQKRHSYTSKSILSILQPTHVLPKSKPSSIQYIIPSSILIIFSIISTWAIFFYLILGVCYYFNSGILLQDLNIHHLKKQYDMKLFTEEISRQFSQLSFHCFFSFGIYLILLFICLLILRYRDKKKLSYQDQI
jgi:hypothetical protein